MAKSLGTRLTQCRSESSGGMLHEKPSCSRFGQLWQTLRRASSFSDHLSDNSRCRIVRWLDSMTAR